MKVYIASSWKNKDQVKVAAKIIEESGNTAYDFTDHDGFHWSEVDPDYENGWTIEQWHENLSHDAAIRGFTRDATALYNSDAVVMLKPCGASAHLELGFAVGLRKPAAIVLDAYKSQPELMYKFANAILPNINKIPEWLESIH